MAGKKACGYPIACGRNFPEAPIPLEYSSAYEYTSHEAHGTTLIQISLRITMNRILSVAFLLVAVVATAASQGYYVGQRFQLPDTTLFTETIALPISPNRDDVKAIGMGKTQIANGITFNAMMYNPALLARNKFRLDIAGFQASIPRTTLSAIDFISANKDQFKSGLFLKQISDGVSEFNNATTLQQRNAAIQKINSGLTFMNSLQSKVVGSEAAPRTHGIGLVPNIQAQFGNWGVSLFATAQAGFQIQPGKTVSDILALKLPSNPDDFTVEAITNLAGIILPLFDPNTGQLDLSEALPVAYAISYVDIVGAAGYAYDVGSGLNVGANLKIINRRISTKRIASDNLDNIVSESRTDFLTSKTGFTIDLGALYTIASTGTEIGLSLQNVIPLQTISSSASVNFEAGAIVDYQRDTVGTPIVNANGDTALVAVQRLISIKVPFELKTPFVASLGARHPITNDWDVALDWFDIFDQDVRFEKYVERIRLGTEYRLEAIKDMLGIALRAGLADNQLTVGLGLNVFRVVQIDGAIAKDQFIGETAYYGQVRIGW